MESSLRRRTWPLTLSAPGYARTGCARQRMLRSKPPCLNLQAQERSTCTCWPHGWRSKASYQVAQVLSELPTFPSSSNMCRTPIEQPDSEDYLCEDIYPNHSGKDLQASKAL
ncbi:hypothetical protein NDU88_001252 [Pleurodeles waltl]|uniref:Uncharacterized protein n=1 Tax=Pleurodeles waltl TaxID=8319 RepID=A0AAV7WHS7_PLEWA|nr:hypothetical protein NDU88_001252 [Pleurodeles waltl]